MLRKSTFFLFLDFSISNLQCHPNFGAVICNLPPLGAANGDSEAAKVLRAMHDGLRAECLKPIEAFASTKFEPVTLYEVSSQLND